MASLAPVATDLPAEQPACLTDLPAEHSAQTGGRGQAGATLVSWNSHPLMIRAFSRRTERDLLLTFGIHSTSATPESRCV